MENRFPLVSVVMPIRNEARYIQYSLGVVLKQDYPHERMEVLVADGLSDDGTREIVKNLQVKHKTPFITLIDNPGRIVPCGLNTAINMAKGEIIVRVDGHTIIAEDYVSQCVCELLRTGATNVGGRMNTVGVTAFGEAVALATSSPFGVGGARFHYSDKEEWVDTVYMGAWHRDIFKQIGLFDEELVRNQDDEFNYRLRTNGGKIFLSPKIKSRYSVRSNPKALWKQYYQYGFWKVRVLQKHPRQMRLSQFVPPAFVCATLLSMVMAFFWPLGRFLLAIIAGTYLFTNLTASIWTASRNNWKSIFILPVVYAILHLSYGLGFLIGLVKFAHRYGDRKG